MEAGLARRDRHIGHPGELPEQSVLSRHNNAQRVDLLMHDGGFLACGIELIADLAHLLGHVRVRSGIAARGKRNERYCHCE